MPRKKQFRYRDRKTKKFVSRLRWQRSKSQGGSRYVRELYSPKGRKVAKRGKEKSVRRKGAVNTRRVRGRSVRRKRIRNIRRMDESLRVVDYGNLPPSEIKTLSQALRRMSDEDEELLEELFEEGELDFDGDQFFESGYEAEETDEY